MFNILIIVNLLFHTPYIEKIRFQENIFVKLIFCNKTSQICVYLYIEKYFIMLTVVISCDVVTSNFYFFLDM